MRPGAATLRFEGVEGTTSRSGGGGGTREKEREGKGQVRVGAAARAVVAASTAVRAGSTDTSRAPSPIGHSMRKRAPCSSPSAIDTWPRRNCAGRKLREQRRLQQPSPASYLSRPSALARRPPPRRLHVHEGAVDLTAQSERLRSAYRAQRALRTAAPGA